MAERHLAYRLLRAKGRSRNGTETGAAMCGGKVRGMRKRGSMAGRTETVSFPVDGELESRTKSTATAFGLLRGVSLDMRRRLPGLSVGLATMLAVIAYRLVRGFLRPRPLWRTCEYEQVIHGTAREKHR